jgi:hypothetical protein
MASITLKDGDFGAGVEIVVNEAEFILPDPARGGLRMSVPFTDVVGMDAINDDRSGQVREAVQSGLKGFSAAGPVGLAASLFAGHKPKSVVFEVRLKDERGFVATAEAATYTTLQGYFRAAARPHTEKGDTPEDRAAEAIVARYMAGKPQGGTVQPPSAETPTGPGSSQPSEAAPAFGRRRSDR